MSVLVNFVFSKFEKTLPTLEDYSKSLPSLISDSTSYFKGPFTDYFNQKMEDLSEKNPQLHETINKKVEQLTPVLKFPQHIINSGVQVIQKTNSYTKRLENAVYPIAEDILEITYKAFISSYKKVKGMYGNDPAKTLEALKDEPWGKEYFRYVKGALFGNWKKDDEKAIRHNLISKL